MPKKIYKIIKVDDLPAEVNIEMYDSNPNMVEMNVRRSRAEYHLPEDSATGPTFDEVDDGE